MLRISNKTVVSYASVEESRNSIYAKWPSSIDSFDESQAYHKQAIEDDMNHSLKDIKLKYQDKKKTGTRKKRQELSLSASRGLNRNQVSVLLDFN